MKRRSKTHETITTTELEALLQADDSLNLIDVREVDEYAGGHIKQAKNVPLSEFAAKVDELDRSKPIYVICASGGRSMKHLFILTHSGSTSRTSTLG